MPWIGHVVALVVWFCVDGVEDVVWDCGFTWMVHDTTVLVGTVGAGRVERDELIGVMVGEGSLARIVILGRDRT